VDDAFQFFKDGLAHYGYPILFCGIMVENAGIPVPGETAVLAAGFLASPAGDGIFSLAFVIPIAFIAAVVGDNIGFWLGYRFARRRLLSGKRFLLLTPRVLQVAEGYFERYGLWTIFFARFITGFRVWGAIAAGTAGMPWPRFLLANAAGALIWAVTMSLLGYFFGHSWRLLHTWLGWGGWALLGTVLICAAIYYWRLTRRPKNPLNPS
jgi:membrane protein DedA with SNARE-associated domain